MYSVRCVGSLDVENFFGGFQDYDPWGTGVLRPDSIPTAISVAAELQEARLDPNRVFHMHTSSSKVYPSNTYHVNMELSLSGTSVPQDLSNIVVRDHGFDKPERARGARKRKRGTITLRMDTITMMSQPVMSMADMNKRRDLVSRAPTRQPRFMRPLSRLYTFLTLTNTCYVRIPNGNSDERLEQSFRERNKHMKEACQFQEKAAKYSIGFNTFVEENHKIVYCQVQKSASSFWKKQLQFFLDPDHHSSHDDLRLGDIKIPRLQRTKYAKQSKWFPSDFFRFTFVRDPYDRLFSGYVGKLYLINTHYWKAIGTYIVKTVRGVSGEHCGHDVTFPEFIKYIIISEKDRRKRDRHFTPMHEHCSPCQLEYDVIGKMENMKEESRYILSILARRMNVSLEFAQQTDKKSVEDSVRSAAKRLYKNRNKVDKYMTFYATMKRVWSSLQIRGLLGRNVSLPFKEYEADQINLTEFTEQLLRALAMSGNKETIKYNKKDALVEAYSRVPMSDLLLLREVVRQDCEIFDYNPTPDHIFNRNRETTEDYPFFNDWS
ncbi:hypothetical protein ScPMuIL_007908 [Solemya velum]